MENEKMHPFREAYLADRSGDMKKRWYINFYVFDIQQNKLVRKQDYSVNDYKTDTERRAYAEIRIKQINDLLKRGFHIDQEKTKATTKENNSDLTIASALRYALKLKKNAGSTYNSYKSEIDLFCGYLKEKANHNIQALTKKEIYGYIDFRNSHGNAGKTINSKLGYLSSLFSRLVKRGIIKENPFAGVEREKEVKSYRNLAYNDAEIAKLSEAIKKADVELWRFVQIIYYSFMRPNEIRQLQVYNVLLSKKQIYVDAYKSKNKKGEYIMIPDGMMDVMIELVKNKTTNDFLFPGSSQGTPISKNMMSERHRTIIKDLDFLHQGHTLYSWKHTGVVKAFLAGINIKSIQLQCRHYSIAETDKYLKSLGLFENFDFQMNMPTLP